MPRATMRIITRVWARLVAWINGPATQCRIPIDRKKQSALQSKSLRLRGPNARCLCRPSSSTRRPKHESVAFFDTVRVAENRPDAKCGGRCKVDPRLQRCRAAIALGGYAKHHAFFRDDATAIADGHRPFVGTPS